MLYCTFLGKQSEQIEKSVDAEITSLSTRVPSLLILDDFDFLSVFNEEEQRQLAVERVFESECTVNILTFMGGHLFEGE